MWGRAARLILISFFGAMPHFSEALSGPRPIGCDCSSNTPSDLYREEVADGLLTVDSPINAGFTYRVNDFATIGGHYLYGNTFGAFGQHLDQSPDDLASRAPMTHRPSRSHRVPRARLPGYSTAWIAEPTAPGILRDNIERLMQEDGGLSFEGPACGCERARRSGSET